MNQCIHLHSSFLFPCLVNSAIAGLQETKDLAGESPPLDSDLFYWKTSFYGKPYEFV